MSEQLKRCPFCGGKPHIARSYIGCSDEDCIGSQVVADVHEWNRRANDQPATPSPAMDAKEE